MEISPYIEAGVLHPDDAEAGNVSPALAAWTLTLTTDTEQLLAWDT